MNLFNKLETREKRKALRKNQTDTEKILWSKLRKRQINGHKIFRQYGIGAYIVDFYCPQQKLVIEVDGGQHFTDEGEEYDKEREEYMWSVGIKTIRFLNLDVLENLEGVFDCISKELPPAPSLIKRGSE